MDIIGYSSPVDKLLTYGNPEPVDAQDWPDYLELGIGQEHVPDLLRMVKDAELWEADEKSPENWAPVHAWRTLAQLHAANAVELLLHLNEEKGADGWAMEELPEVYGLIGAAAIPTLEAYIADKSHAEDALSAESGLEYMAELHPEDRSEVVAALIRLLEVFEENDPTVNGFLISTLVKLKELEALPLIERAFASGNVDESIIGDWDDVQVELGLKEPSPEQSSLLNLFDDVHIPLPSITREVPTIVTPNPGYFAVKTHDQRVPTRKPKKKMAKQSRKKHKKRR